MSNIPTLLKELDLEAEITHKRLLLTTSELNFAKGDHEPQQVSNKDDLIEFFERAYEEGSRLSRICPLKISLNDP